MKSTLFWDVIQRGLTEVYRLLEEGAASIFRVEEDGRRQFLRNIRRIPLH
jgi:hypothetical protein